MPPTSYGLENVELGAAISLGLTIFIVALVWRLIKRASRHESLRGILYDEKNYPSLNNFQFLVWTMVFLFAIIWLYAIRVQTNQLTIPLTVPLTVFALMGVSTTSAVLSKSISQRKYRHLHAAKKRPSLWMMLYEGGKPSLPRAQMFFWTVASSIIYVSFLVNLLLTPFLFNLQPTPLETLTIPQVDPTLVSLMGFSHAAHLGGKYFTPQS